MAIQTYYYDTIVVGSGVAGFNAADWLVTLGRKNICLITEGIKKGTSRNTGSDKQTYYKLSLGSSEPDSVLEMAKTLYEGGGVEGGVALAEAAGSVQSFMKLVNLGVDFPTNAYGEFVGYKTDHDPRERATSVGPLTSKMMTEALEKSVLRRNVKIHNKTTVIKLLKNNETFLGVIGIEKINNDYRLCYFKANHIIWCTGGQSNCYKDSVYPISQTGMSGVLLEQGIEASNLMDWQYGLASIKFRWNVSGTYQQVIPKYISIDQQGVEREFLFEKEDSDAEILNKIFLKGYQWPFDTTKIGGSSDIDLMVYHETVILGRKVYLDFRENSKHFNTDFSQLSEEALKYLENSKALFGTPIQRLEKMNPLAIELYKSHNIDLYHEPLEIKVCAQHQNGGIHVNKDWETNVSGIYVAGEAAGTFGEYRPGGSALNSTQVGSMRAAQHICRTTKEYVKNAVTDEEIDELSKYKNILEKIVSNGKSIQDQAKVFQKGMSKVAGHIRSVDGMEKLKRDVDARLSIFFKEVEIKSTYEIPKYFKMYDMLLVQSAVLSAMIESTKTFGTRGAGLVEGVPKIQLSENLKIITKRLLEEDGETAINFTSRAQKVRSLPQSDSWFETVWEEHRNIRQISRP